MNPSAHLAVASVSADLTLCGLVLEGSDGSAFPFPLRRSETLNLDDLNAPETCTKCARRLAGLLGAPIRYVIPEENRAAVDERIAKLNRRAAKLGVSPLEVSWTFDHLQKWTEGEGSERREFARRWMACTLLGGAVVRLPGWAFLATLHHTTDGNIVAAVPGFEVPREYRNAPSACHHCRTTRRRSATYLLREDATGNVVQVGRDCLQDFLGGDPHRMASWAELLGAFASWFTPMEEEDRRPRTEWSFSLAQFMDATVRVIRKDGWVSKKLASESNDRTATATTAWRLLTTPLTTESARKFAEWFAPVEEDAEMTRRVVEWAEETYGDSETAKTDLNDYEHNLSVIVRSGIVNLRVSGLAASLVQAYRRANQVKSEAKENATTPSAHVGTVGERLRDLPVTIAAVIPMPPTEFGPRELVKFRDDAGNLLVWFTGSLGVFLFPPQSLEGLDGADAEDVARSNGRSRAPVSGDRMWLTGTVKEHSSFAGSSQTVLSRCALASVAPTPKKAKAKKKGAAA